MPIYKYHCENCEFEQEQFLNLENESITLICQRCLRQTIGRQERNNAVEYHKNGDIIGTVNHEETGA